MRGYWLPGKAYPRRVLRNEPWPALSNRGRIRAPPFGKMPVLEFRLDNGAIPSGDLSETEASDVPRENNRPANPASVRCFRGNKFCSNASAAAHGRLFRHLNFLSYLYESRSQCHWSKPSRPVWSGALYVLR